MRCDPDDAEPTRSPRTIPTIAAAAFEARNACGDVFRIPADMSSAAIDSRFCFGLSRSIVRESHATSGAMTRSPKRRRSGPPLTLTFPYVAAERMRARRLRAGSVARFATARTEIERQIAAASRSIVITP